MKSNYASYNADATDKANHYCSLAVICLCGALLSFGVGTFISTPESIAGIIFTILGALLALSGSWCFVLFARYSKREKKQGE